MAWRGRGWIVIGMAALAGCAETAPLAPGLQPVLCYRTLADIACYTRTDPGRESRVVGVYFRLAEDPARADFWLVEPAGGPEEPEPEAAHGPPPEETAAAGGPLPLFPVSP
jgi:hypothetical protein